MLYLLIAVFYAISVVVDFKKLLQQKKLAPLIFYCSFFVAGAMLNILVTAGVAIPSPEAAMMRFFSEVLQLK